MKKENTKAIFEIMYSTVKGFIFSFMISQFWVLHKRIALPSRLIELQYVGKLLLGLR